MSLPDVKFCVGTKFIVYIYTPKKIQIKIYKLVCVLSVAGNS